MLEILDTMSKAHEEIKLNIEKGQLEQADTLLIQCQETAIDVGTAIDSFEGEGTEAVRLLEEYCEQIFKIHEEIANSHNKLDAHRLTKTLSKALIKAENSLKNDIKVRKEAVFIPYKASMWDSLESIWMAADADPDCDAYVIPIPYYDRNPDGSFKEMHYEADKYPSYVPITKYDEFDFANHNPDMIFTHNPYDNANYVTSIHPYFYSDNMKKYTDCLVYVPYYATAGDMSDAQELCPAYIYADYIVIQSEKYRKFFDPRLPDEKFLAFGSPKFDSIIRKCKNPPELPEAWAQKIYDENGNKKKVYFYNTSLNGMLYDTESFLKKMEYVFSCFRDRSDVCILWRPHPLMESSFDSMRPKYKNWYMQIKGQFIEEDYGIYDDTPSIEDTVSHSDVYLGDSATSVTSLFGVAGKPLFILKNMIHEGPKEEDYKYEVFMIPRSDGKNKYCITQGNKLYYSLNNDFHYEYLCDLNEYAIGNYYSGALEYKDKVYVFPANAENILVIDKDKKIKKIVLQHEVEKRGAFSGSGYYLYEERYVFIFPYNYPALVRIDLETCHINYTDGVRDFNVGMVNDEQVVAARWFYKGKLCMLNIEGTKLLTIDVKSLEITIKDVALNGCYTSVTMKEQDDEEVWLLPLEGTRIAIWNQETNDIKYLDLYVDGLEAIKPVKNFSCNQRYFSGACFKDNEIVFSPYWGKKFVKYDVTSGTVEEIDTPFYVDKGNVNDYIVNTGVGVFVRNAYDKEKYTFYSYAERKTYEYDVRSNTAKEINIVFNRKDVELHESGFSETSQWLQYSCLENSINGLGDLLDNKIHGNQFDYDKAIQAFSKINASVDGDCGEKVYSFVSQR